MINCVLYGTFKIAQFSNSRSALLRNSFSLRDLSKWFSGMNLEFNIYTFFFLQLACKYWAPHIKKKSPFDIKVSSFVLQHTYKQLYSWYLFLRINSTKALNTFFLS